MPKTRYNKRYIYPKHLFPAEKTLENAIVEEIPYEVSDEELADEAEAKAMAKADELIDQITTLAGAKLFLKRLCGRLIKKGYLP